LTIKTTSNKFGKVYIRNIIGGSRKTNEFPEIVTNGIKTYQCTHIANEFNNYFGTITEKNKNQDTSY